jgi:hypothetical protein
LWPICVHLCHLWIFLLTPALSTDDTDEHRSVSSPVRDRVNRDPASFVGKTLTLEARLSTACVLGGNEWELQVLNKNEARPGRLHFVARAELAERWAR